MTATITDQRTTLDDADVDDWTGTDGLDTSAPDPVELSGCLGLVVSTETQEAYDTLTSDDWSAGGTYSFWARAYGAMDNTVNGGIQGIIGDGTDRNGYHVGGSDKTGFRHFDGPVEWANFVLDPANLPTDVTNFAGVEANLTLTAVTQFGVAFKTLAKSVGGSRNCHIDICRWADLGVGITIQGGATSGAAGNMEDAAAADRSTTSGDAHGVVHELAAGVYGIQGNVILGNSASASDQYWAETNVTYALEDRGLSDRNYYRLSLVGSSTATNCEFSFDATTFSVPSGADARFDGNGADITVCNITGGTFIGWNVGIVTSDDTGDDWTNAAFIDCGNVWAKGCDLTGATLSGTPDCALIESQTQANYDDTTTEGGWTTGNGFAVNDTITLSNGAVLTVNSITVSAVATFTVTTSEGYPAHIGEQLTMASTSGSGTAFSLWPRSSNLDEGGSIFYDLAVDPDGELDDLTITKGTADTHAAVFGPNIPSEITLRGWTTSGYSASNNVATSTLHFLDTTGTITVNIIGGSGNFSYKTEGATIDIVTNPVTLTFTPLITGSDVSVFAAGTSTPLTATDSSGTSFPANVTSGASIDYKIYKKGYLPIEVYAVSFTVSQNVLVNQQEDGNYDEVD